MAKLKDILFPVQPVPVSDWQNIPARNIATGQSRLTLALDRSALTGADHSILLEAEFEITLDGINWGIGWTDPATGIFYTLDPKMKVGDGVESFRGVVQQFSTMTVYIPQSSNPQRQIRGRYKVHLARSWGFSIDTE